MTLETAELVVRARGGASDAFAELVTRFGPAAAAAAFAETGERAAALECAEEAFVRTRALLERLEHGERFGTLVVGFARSVGAERPKTAPATVEDLLARGQLERRAGLGLVVRGDLLRALGALLMSVDRDSRVAIALVTYGDYGYEEAASLLGTDCGSVARAISGGLGAIAARVSASLRPICSDAERLPAVLDDELPLEDRVAIEQHLAGCKHCTDWLADLAAVRRTLRGGLASALPRVALEELRGRVLARIGERPAAGGASCIAQPPAGPAPCVDLVGRVIAGYRIVRKIGSGGMGAVYRAEQLSLGRPVALKVLSPRFASDEGYVRRFMREARAAARLDHLNVVRTYDAGREGDIYYYAMELVEGESLSERLKRGRLAPKEALAVVCDIARALQHAARHGIVHRDVKPENILIERASGTAKLADLGLARAEEGLEQDGSLTVTGTLFGTPSYMSPEQARDTHSADHRSDIYSLGATLYRMLYGRVPFEAPSPLETISRVLTEELVPPQDPAVPPGFVKVLRHMTAYDADDRYQSAAELLEDLADLAAGLPPARASKAVRRKIPRAVAEGGATARAVAPAVHERRLEARLPARRAVSARPHLVGAGLIAALALGGLGLHLFGEPSAWLSGLGGEPGRAAGRSLGRREPVALPRAEEPAAVVPAVPALAVERRGPAKPSEPPPAPSAAAEPPPHSPAPAVEKDVPRAQPPEAPAPAPAAEPEIRLREEGSAARTMALEAYSARRVEFLRALAELKTGRALAIIADAERDPGLAAIRDEIEMDRQDVELLDRLVAGARAGLHACEGRFVRLELCGSKAELAGNLERNESVFFVREPGGGLRQVRLEELTEAALAELAARAPEPFPASGRAATALAVARNAPEAPALIQEFAARGGPEPAVASYRAKLALAREAEAREAALAEEEAVRPLLRRLAALEARLGSSREARKDLAEIQRLLRQLLEKHAAAPSIEARREELQGRLREVEKALADDEVRPEALIPRLFHGKTRLLADGRVEVAYDFGRREAREMRSDFRRVQTVENLPLRAWLERMGGAIPPPYDRAAPWEIVEGGLLGRGLERLLWRGVIEGAVEVEVTATPLAERTVAVTLCDGENRYYVAGAGFVLPRPPEFLRPRFPDILKRFDPFVEPADRLIEVQYFPGMREIARGRSGPLAARQTLRLKAARSDGSTAADGRPIEVRLALVIQGAKPLEAVDTTALLRKGSVGLAAFGSGVVFRSLRITGKLEAGFLDAERRRLAEKSPRPGEK